MREGERQKKYREGKDVIETAKGWLAQGKTEAGRFKVEGGKRRKQWRKRRRRSVRVLL